MSVCPPPDLAVEIEISRSAIDRLGIYAALGVPEVWRCDEQSVRVFVLTADGTYKEQESSLNLPALPLNVLSQFLSQRHTLDTTRLVKNFRRWVRENIVG